MKEKDSRDNMSKNFHSHANKTETELVDEWFGMTRPLWKSPNWISYNNEFNIVGGIHIARVSELKTTFFSECWEYSHSG